MNAAPGSVLTALSALTTIVVNTGDSRDLNQQRVEQIPLQQQVPTPVNDNVEIPIKTSSQPIKRYPQVVDDTTTTTKIHEIYETHEIKREEIIRYSPTNASEVNQEITETVNTSDSYTDPTTSHYHQVEQDVDEDRARREYAGNYTNTLVYNVYKQMNLEQQQAPATTTTTTTSNSDTRDQTKFNDNKLTITDRAQISDELKYLLDNENFPDYSSYSISAANASSTLYHENKTYTFHKDLKSDSEFGVKQPSLAQIINSFKAGDCMLACDELPPSCITDFPYAPPYSLGIRFRPHQNPLEVGNHIISHIEAGSLAETAGLKVNSRLFQINEITCEDKTHEFVLFFLNYVLRKNSCSKIELTVDEPLELAHESNAHIKAILRDIQQSSLSFVYDNDNYSDATSSLSVAEGMDGLLVGQDHLRSIMTEATTTANNLKSTSSTSYRMITPFLEDTAPYLSVSSPAICSESSTLYATNLAVSENNNISLQTQLLPPIPTSTNTLSYSSTLPALITTSTTDATASTSQSSTGIENLKSIIMQITRIKNDSDSFLASLNTTKASTHIENSTSANSTFGANLIPEKDVNKQTDDEYSYETSIKIQNVYPYVNQETYVTQETTSNLNNLKLVLTEAINSNYDDYMQLRGIFQYSCDQPKTSKNST